MALGSFSSLAESSEILQYVLPLSISMCETDLMDQKDNRNNLSLPPTSTSRLSPFRYLAFYCHYSNNSTDTRSLPSIKKSWRHTWIQVLIQPLKSIQTRS